MAGVEILALTLPNHMIQDTVFNFMTHFSPFVKEKR